MPIRLTEAEYAKLKAPAKKARRKRAERTTHDWELVGKRYVCQRCGMGIPLRFWPTWKDGAYKSS